MTTPFPSDDALNKDPNTKEGIQWWLTAARSIWSKYAGSTKTMQYVMFTRDVKSGFAKLRAYGRGMQDPAIYIARISPGTTQKRQTNVPDQKTIQTTPPSLWGDSYRNQQRKGFANVDSTIFTYAPKINRLITSLIQKTNHHIRVTSISERSITQKQDMKYRTWVAKVFQPLFEELEKTGGIPAPKPYFMPRTREQLEVYAAVGGFKVMIEIALEKAALHTLQISEYDSEIDAMVIEDLKDYNMAVLYDYHDMNLCGAVKIGHRIPDNLIIQYTKERRFNNSPYVGYEEQISIKQLRDEIISAGQSWFDKRRVMKLLMSSSQYTSTQNNQFVGWNLEMDPITRNYQYDDFLVTVARMEYLTKKFRLNSIHKTEKGEKYYEEDETDNIELSESSKNKGKKRDIISYQTRYSFTYVPGIDYVYNINEHANLKREKKHTVQSDYHVVKIPGRSITDQLTTLYDELQILHMKYQNHIINTKPPGVSVEFGSMQDAIIGGDKYDVFDFLQIYNESGNLLYSASVRQGKLVNNGKPIEELAGGLGQTFSNWIVAFNHCVTKMFDVAGIAQAVQAAAAISGEKTLGSQELERQATDVNLDSISKERNRLKEMAIKGALLRIMTSIQADEEVREYYKSAIGEIYVDAIMQLDDLTLEKLGIELKAAPNDLQARMILEKLAEAQQPGQDGHPTLQPDEYFYVFNAVLQGQLSEAQMFLAECINRKRQHMEAIAAQNAKTQAEEVQKLETMKQQAEKDSHERKLAEIRVTEEEKRKTVVVQEEEKRKTALLLNAQKATEAPAA